MKTKFTAFLFRYRFLILVAAVLTAAYFIVANFAFVTHSFEDKNYGISVQLPNQWCIQHQTFIQPQIFKTSTEDNNATLYIYARLTNENLEAFSNLSDEDIAAFAESHDQDYKEYLKESINDIESIRDITRTYVTINGNRFIKTEVGYRLKGRTYDSVLREWFTLQKIGYRLNVYSIVIDVNKDNDDMKRLAQDTVSTIRIK